MLPADLEKRIDVSGKSAVIRQARPADIPGLRALYDQVYEGKYPLELVQDPQEMSRALGRPDHLWFAIETGGAVVGSVIFSIDTVAKLGKVFGGVVHPRYRGADLTEEAVRLGLDHLVGSQGVVNSVYATARTVSSAPLKLLRNLGFKELGVFPNVRKVENYETHCLMAFFARGALEARIGPPKLPTVMRPFYEIVQRAVGLPPAHWRELQLTPPSPYHGGWTQFEIIEAQGFIRRRWRALKEHRKLKMPFLPFVEPNLLLVATDESAEIYLDHSTQDHHASIVGGYDTGVNLTHLLNSLVLALEEYGVRYLELITDAYHPRVMKSVLEARFIPSAYYPAMRWKHGRGRDYVMFSKSFVLLDFKSIAATGLLRDYLREYVNSWKSLYTDELP